MICKFKHLREMRTFLNNTFANRRIGRSESTSQFPDLNPLDFYFWPFKIYCVFNANNVDDLRERI